MYDNIVSDVSEQEESVASIKSDCEDITTVTDSIESPVNVKEENVEVKTFYLKVLFYLNLN